jgi:cytoskeleton protein RodZ
MSDAQDAGSTAPAAPEGRSAGRLLREAREKQGLHLAALATSIKVAPRKLEALEADRLADLHDAAFARALAKTVCRALKIDPVPVLALLPSGTPPELDRMAGGLNAPYRERARAQGDRAEWLGVLTRPAVWGTALLLGAAAAVAFLPPGGGGAWLQGFVSAASAPVPAASTAASDVALVVPQAPAAPVEASAPAPSASAVPFVETVHSVPPGAVEPAASGAVAIGGPQGVALVLRAREETWVEVVDARGAPLLSRMLVAGETVGIDGAPPLKLRVGNAAGTEVAFRGQPVDLLPVTRDNVARLQLN